MPHVPSPSTTTTTKRLTDATCFSLTQAACLSELNLAKLFFAEKGNEYRWKCCIFIVSSWSRFPWSWEVRALPWDVSLSSEQLDLNKHLNSHLDHLSICDCLLHTLTYTHYRVGDTLR
jgi:hypothetical protein